jgi:hypothetical protein
MFERKEKIKFMFERKEDKNSTLLCCFFLSLGLTHRW